MDDSTFEGRRAFIKKTGLMAAAALALQGCAPNPPAFSPSARACLIALAERIIPRDDYPGATDAGVIGYIENWVTKYYPERLDFYVKGLDCLQGASLAAHSKEFQDLDADAQDAMLSAMEKGALSKEHWGGGVAQKDFFEEILERSMQGFYGDPRHGGNRGFASHRMMKFETPLVIGQNRYRAHEK